MLGICLKEMDIFDYLSEYLILTFASKDASPSVLINRRTMLLLLISVMAPVVELYSIGIFIFKNTSS